MPAVSAMLGAAALGGGISAGSNIISQIGNYHISKDLMEREQEFNANEAKKSRDWQKTENLFARDWQAGENAIQRDWQTNANKIAMDFSHKEAIAQREWEQMMSSTAHQREVADLRAAGLNPILAASSGGADSPTGATAGGVSTSAGSVSTPGSGSASTARSNARGVNLGDLRSVGDFVRDYLNDARAVLRDHDKFEHEIDMLNIKQGKQVDKSKDKSELDDFFKAALAKAQRE